jgi:glutamate-5-semialdehyde dehydrogenase
MTGAAIGPAHVRDEVVAAVRQARDAARILALAAAAQKNAALREMAERLSGQARNILEANAQDVAAAKAAGLAKPLIERLTLNDRRLEEMRDSVRSVAELADPVGAVISEWTRPNGLRIKKVRVPLGVVGIIFESRPNVTSECGSLCVKSGNAAVLRGGTEAYQSNQAIASALRGGLAHAGLPEAAITMLPTADRAAIDVMLGLDSLIDVIIPRGGEALIRKVTEGSRIPVIKHAKGVCHVYVDEAADLAMAEAIAVNAKCQRPATCNAMETLLVHERVAQAFLGSCLRRLQEMGVELRGDEATRALVPGVKPATEEDWSTEYLDLVLSVRVVRSLDEAAAHIARYGSSHSDAIVTKDQAAAKRFVQAVDSAAVYVNASTRFTDGFQFGLGAEIGISTDRLHARGPMGLEELTTYKYVVHGEGQLRE